MRKGILAALGVMLLALLLGCLIQSRTGGQKNEAEKVTQTIFAMDTVMTFTAYGEHGEEAVEAAVQEVQRLDALLSTGSAASEVSAINAAGSGAVSEDTAAILAEALRLYESTEGLFDFTVYPLMLLWGFPTGEYHVPTEEELAGVLPLVDASRVSFDGTTVTLAKGQQMDFGGIAKGYTSARVMEIYAQWGVTSGMVSLGGNMQVLNTKPDGSKWKIGIQDPDGETGTVIAVLEVENQAVITSGGYERYFEENGETYIHILDPRTGYPADNGPKSVTIISDDGMLADGLSTSLFLMGLEDAIAYWRMYAEEFDMLFITEDDTIYVTEGMIDSLTTGSRVVVIERD